MNYLCDELEELDQKVRNDGKLSISDLQYGDAVAHFEKSLLTNEAMKKSDYSYDWENHGNSGARRRDSMRRFEGRRYSRDDAKSHMTHELERLMDNAQSQEERDVLQRAVNQLKNM